MIRNASEKSSSNSKEFRIRTHYHPFFNQYMVPQNIDFNNNRLANFHRRHSGLNVIYDVPAADPGLEDEYIAKLVSSDDAPDLMWMDRDRYYHFASLGVLTETTPYLDEMHDYVSLVKDTGILEAAKYQDKLLCFPDISEETDMNQTTEGGIFVRQDIMENLKLSAPATINDYYHLLKTVQEKTGYIPLAVRNDCIFSSDFRAIKAAFRVALSYKRVGDRLEYIWIQPEYKEYLSFMHMLYAEGLLDNEYSEVNTTELMKKFTEDKVFSGIDGWAFPSANLVDIAKKIAGAKLVYLPQPYGPNGEKALVAKRYPAEDFWVVPKGAKHKEAAAKFMNYMATPIAKRAQDCGIEGIDYTLNSDGTVNQTLEESLGIVWRACFEIMNTPASFQLRLKNKGYLWAYNQGLEGQNDAEMEDDLFFSKAPNSEFLKIQAKLALQPFVDEKEKKFIKGELNISEFDTYVQELKSRGLDELTAGLNKWLK